MKLDADIEDMNLDQLRAALLELRAGVRKHRDAQGHDNCWFHPELWALLPEGFDSKPKDVPSWPAFMVGCIRYRRSLDKP